MVMVLLLLLVVMMQVMQAYIRGLFESFVGLPYYTMSGGGVTVSLFLRTSLGKQCTSYNAPLTSRKCAAHKLQGDSVTGIFLPQSFLFMVDKDQKSHGERSGLRWLDG